MKEIIKERLKFKFPGVNLSNQRIEEFASKLEKKIKDESDIDSWIDEMNDLHPFEEIAKSDDKVRTLEAKEKKTELPKKEELVSKKEPEAVPEWAKGLIEEVKNLRIEKQTQSMQQKIAANEKLKGIDAKLYAKWKLPEKDEDIESFVDEIADTYGHLVKQDSTESFIPGRSPRATKKEASQKEIDSIVDRIMPQELKINSN